MASSVMDDLMKKVAKIRIGLPRELVTVARDSMMPETRTSFPRTSVRIESSDDELILIFEAKDTPALRAVLNSYLGWIKMIQEIYERLT